MAADVSRGVTYFFGGIAALAGIVGFAFLAYSEVVEGPGALGPFAFSLCTLMVAGACALIAGISFFVWMCSDEQ